MKYMPAGSSFMMLLVVVLSAHNLRHAVLLPAGCGLHQLQSRPDSGGHRAEPIWAPRAATVIVKAIKLPRKTRTTSRHHPVMSTPRSISGEDFGPFEFNWFMLLALLSCW